MADKLGIIAGRGELPRMVIDACRETGRDFHVFAIDGQTDPSVVAETPHRWFRLGAAGQALDLAKQQNIGEVLLVGGVERPSLGSLRPDWRTMRFLMRLGRKGLGDDGILRRIVAEIESEGFRVVGLETVMKDVKPGAGCLGRLEPDETAQADIDRSLQVLRAMSVADVGQAVIVQQGLVLGVEAIEGTDALLARCADLKRDGPGGVLVKMQKRGQDTRMDLPTIGPATVRGAAEAGLRGIAIQAEGTIVIGRDEVIETADRLGLFVVAIDDDLQDRD